MPIEESPEENDAEYELEEVDEHVLAQEQARAKAEIRRARTAIDVDEVYREYNQQDDYDEALKNLRPQFSVKTLLIAATLLGVLLGVWRGGVLTGQFFAALIMLSLIVLGGLHLWISWQEAKRHTQAIEKRKRQLTLDRGEEPPASSAEEGPAIPSWAQELLTGRFTTLDLLMATLAAAVLLTLVDLLGGPARAAGALGVIAIGGLALRAADINTPRFAVLAWWFALVAFGVMALLAVFAQGLGLA